MPTIVSSPNTYGDAWPAGQITLQVQFCTYEYSGLFTEASDVQIEITASGTAMTGTGTPVALTSDGITELSEGMFQYIWNVPDNQAAGDYYVNWTGVRASDGMTVTYQQTVTVAASPSGSPAPGCYATVTQYQARTGDTLTPVSLVQTRICLASEDINMAIIGAVYAVDADGMPLSPFLTDVLMRATIEQVRYLNAMDDDALIKREFSSMNVAGVTYSRSAKTQGTALPPVASRALSILKNAGVLPKAILINW